MDLNHRLSAGSLQRICHWSSLLNFETLFGGMVSKFRREDHALFISCAHAILPQISRRVGHKISLQGFAGSDAWTDPWNYHANLRRNGGPYRARCAGPRPCAYVLVDTAKAVPVQRHAAHQRPLVATDPDGVPWVAQALLGKTLLGQRLFLNHLWECHWRHHHAVSGITFLQMMLPASAGSGSLFPWYSFMRFAFCIYNFGRMLAGLG